METTLQTQPLAYRLAVSLLNTVNGHACIVNAARGRSLNRNQSALLALVMEVEHGAELIEKAKARHLAFLAARNS